MILGFDPGRDKCGIALMNQKREILYHQVVESVKALATLDSLVQDYHPQLIVMGDQTTAKTWKQALETKLTSSLSIVMVDERNSTLEARDRYWEMYPAKGLARLIPQGMRIPPRPVDDIVAILLIERYWQRVDG